MTDIPHCGSECATFIRPFVMSTNYLYLIISYRLCAEQNEKQLASVLADSVHSDSVFRIYFSVRMGNFR